MVVKVFKPYLDDLAIELEQENDFILWSLKNVLNLYNCASLVYMFELYSINMNLLETIEKMIFLNFISEKSVNCLLTDNKDYDYFEALITAKSIIIKNNIDNVNFSIKKH